MQIDQLIDHGRGALQHHGGQGRVAALRLELTEVFGRHLPTLAGQLEQAVLVDVPAQGLRASPPTEMSSAARCVPACAESWVSAVPAQPVNQ